MNGCPVVQRASTFHGGDLELLAHYRGTSIDKKVAYIHCFGGDPDIVTLSEKMLALTAHVNLLMRESWRLFHRVL
jgi:hypothetical protein